jgi:hypothetical protein
MKYEKNYIFKICEILEIGTHFFTASKIWPNKRVIFAESVLIRGELLYYKKLPNV